MIASGRGKHCPDCGQLMERCIPTSPFRGGSLPTIYLCPCGRDDRADAMALPPTVADLRSRWRGE